MNANFAATTRYVFLQVREIYPWLLCFYLTSLGITLFLPDWKHYLYWPGLHIVVGLATVLAIASVFIDKGVRKRNPKRFLNGTFGFYLKCLLTLIAALVFLFFTKTNPLGFWLFIYGALSILFGYRSDLAKGLMLGLLALALVFLGLRHTEYAEATLVYWLSLCLILTIEQLQTMHASEHADI